MPAGQPPERRRYSHNTSGRLSGRDHTVTVLGGQSRWAMYPKTLLRIRLFFVLAVLLTFPLQLVSAQQKQVVWSANEQPLADHIHGLRSLPDDVRAGTTKDLALKIRKLPPTENKLRLAVNLAGLSRSEEH